MTFPLVIIAGADDRLHDKLRGESPDAFAPHGELVVEPSPGGLTTAHAASLLSRSRNVLRKLSETVPVNVVVLAVTPPDVDEEQFRSWFFPFALYVRVEAPVAVPNASKNATNRALNLLVGSLKKRAIEARRRADLVKGVVSKANMTPLLLPLRNFRNPHLQMTLDTLYDGLGVVPDPAALIAAETARFVAAVPYAKHDGSPRRCFSDGVHRFKSPGRERHGYYQNSRDAAHGKTCILNARARLGGSYPHDFHFDCEPVRALARTYPNCHDDPCPPKERHVNVAPSDGIV